MVIKVALAAEQRGVGYFEYLRLLRQAREEFGETAGNFELALSLALNRIKAEVSERARQRRGGI
jgi:hypothetical protein